MKSVRSIFLLTWLALLAGTAHLSHAAAAGTAHTTAQNQTYKVENTYSEQAATFGSEWEFSNDKARNSGSGPWGNTAIDIAMLLQTQEEFKKYCAETHRCTMQNARVHFANGFFLDVTKDHSVVELKTKPMTLAEWQQIAQDIQQDVFEVAKRAGLTVDPEVEASHVHIGLYSAFAHPTQKLINYRQFRNFIVDQLNHSEIASGILDFDDLNSPALSLAKKRILQTVLKKYDAKNIEWITIDGLDKFVSEFEHIAYGRSYADKHYQAINLQHIGPDKDPAAMTIELRAVSMRTSAREFIKLIRLLNARLELIKSYDGYIPLLRERPVADMQEGYNRFYQYVTETGLSWREMKTLIRADYKGMSVTAKKSCASLLRAN